MGQAKQRGTFEQRQAEGIAKKQEQERKRREALAAQEAEYAAQEAEYAAREARKTPEERDRSRRAKLFLTSILGTMVASSTARGLEVALMAAEYRDR